MSILIKGMEMPTTCGNCPVHKLWAEDDEAQCMIKRELWTKYSKRNPDCPLIEVPPHGRLIDADAAIKSLPPIEDYDFVELCTLDTAKRLVRKALQIPPTVIPADKDGEI